MRFKKDFILWRFDFVDDVVLVFESCEVEAVRVVEEEAEEIGLVVGS
jgi:hypothetical protein